MNMAPLAHRSSRAPGLGSAGLPLVPLLFLASAALAAAGCAPQVPRTPESGPATASPRTVPADSPVAAGVAPREGASDLVDVLELDPTFVLDVRYATPRNFTGRILYPVARCLLRRPVAERLVRVHARLKEAGLRLRLFDCYRPLSIQRELWARVPDERYVADPAKGSRHNRAAAVDLTLADSSGAELPMPTEYDDFTPLAHRDYRGGEPGRLANRDRLERAMAREGFLPLPTEWWHFDAPDWKEHAILDAPLSLAKPKSDP